MKVTVRNLGEVVLEADVEPGERVPIPDGTTFTSIEDDTHVYVFTPQSFDPVPAWKESLKTLHWS